MSERAGAVGVEKFLDIPRFTLRRSQFFMGVFTKLRGLFSGGALRVDIGRRFELIARVGQGSMSRVFRARDSTTGRIVALKILDRRKTAELAARFAGVVKPIEGEVAVSLRHPNIVSTYEHGLTRDREQFLVMEFVEGVGLNFLIETKSPALAGRRVEYLLQTARALSYFHGAGYIHRDVCPRNLLVNPEGVVKLIDFGLAVPATPPFMRPGNRTGTASYMAPELIMRQPTDQRIDVYSFGVTAYEVICGRLPYEATQSLQAVLQHVNQPPIHPLEVRADLDETTVKMLLKGLERDPRARWRSMSEFIDALENLPRKDY